MDFDREMLFPFGPAAKYAWPGGYPIGYLMDDGEFLCADCINDESNPVHCNDSTTDGWRLVGMQVLDSDDLDETCSHCGSWFFPEEST